MSLPIMEPVQSLNLFSLPREIRDSIYGHTFRGRVFSQRSTTAPPLFTIPDLRMDGKNGPNFEIFEDPNGLEILLASKAVNREATQSFYAECEFKFTYSESPGKDGLPLPDLAMMGQLRKVEFTIKHIHRISSPVSETNVERDHHFASVVTSMACQNRQRQTLTLVLDGYVGHSRCLHHAKWLRALKDLKTHSTAVIKIKILPDWNSSGWPFPQYGRWEEREELMNDIKHALEPTLGAARSSNRMTPSVSSSGRAERISVGWRARLGRSLLSLRTALLRLSIQGYLEDGRESKPCRT